MSSCLFSFLFFVRGEHVHDVRGPVKALSSKQLARRESIPLVYHVAGCSWLGSHVASLMSACNLYWVGTTSMNPDSSTREPTRTPQYCSQSPVGAWCSHLLCLCVLLSPVSLVSDTPRCNIPEQVGNSFFVFSHFCRHRNSEVAGWGAKPVLRTDGGFKQHVPCAK